MKVEIDFQCTNRFRMSMGFTICMISIVPTFMLLYGSNPKAISMSFAVVFCILLLPVGLFLLRKGYNGLKEFEVIEEKLKFEFMVNQILDQDLKLIHLKIKQLEYNEKVRLLKEKNKSTSTGIKDLNEVQLRDIPDIVVQALNPNFYEETYQDIIKKIRKRRNE